MGRYLWVKFLLFCILRVATFYPTHGRGYRVLVLSATISVAAHICLETTEPIPLLYYVGAVTASHLTFIAYILGAEETFPNHWKRVRDGVFAESDASASNNSPSDFPFKKKFWWMLDLAHSPRMVGWVQQPQNCLPACPSSSRGIFLQKTFLKLILNVVINDVLTFVYVPSPPFDPHFPQDSTYVPKTVFATTSLLHHAPYVLAFGVMTATSLSAAHNIAALTLVGLGNSSPTLWPDLWGNWGDAYTIRKLWGRTWHQQMRPMLAGLGRLVANKMLKFPNGTNRSSYTQLYIAFFLSAAIHFVGDSMFRKRVAYYSFKFMLLQAVAITFEDLAIYIAKRFLPQKGIEINPGRADESWAGAVVRVMGYCWVTLWFCVTAPEWRDKTGLIGVGPSYAPISQFIVDTWKQRT